jgi:hypothetical protein
LRYAAGSLQRFGSIFIGYMSTSTVVASVTKLEEE